MVVPPHRPARRLTRHVPAMEGRAMTITDKRALRARMRASRDAFVLSGRACLPVPDAFTSRLKDRPVVAAYCAVGGEADPTPLVDAARALGCPIALPHVVDRSTPLRFLHWNADQPLVAGPFGLSQPAAGGEELAPDIILTPMVAFDHRLDRLGQGGGHYDRAFARYPDAWRIGIAWSVQEVAAIPTDVWDQPLHAIITERGMIAHHGD